MRGRVRRQRRQRRKTGCPAAAAAAARPQAVVAPQYFGAKPSISRWIHSCTTHTSFTPDASNCARSDHSLTACSRHSSCRGRRQGGYPVKAGVQMRCCLGGAPGRRRTRDVAGRKRQVAAGRRRPKLPARAFAAVSHILGGAEQQAARASPSRGRKQGRPRRPPWSAGAEHPPGPLRLDRREAG